MLPLTDPRTQAAGLAPARAPWPKVDPVYIHTGTPPTVVPRREEAPALLDAHWYIAAPVAQGMCAGGPGRQQHRHDAPGGEGEGVCGAGHGAAHAARACACSLLLVEQGKMERGGRARLEGGERQKLQGLSQRLVGLHETRVLLGCDGLGGLCGAFAL